MGENKTMDQIHRGLLKKFHTLCSVLHMTEDQKKGLLSSWGVESSRDLDQHQLIDICAKLSEMVNKKQGKATLDQLRKRVIAAIGGWLRATYQSQGISKIKGIACRATGYDDFNKIPRERLYNLIAAFNNKVKDVQSVEGLTSAMLMQSIMGGSKGEA